MHKKLDLILEHLDEAYLASRNHYEQTPKPNEYLTGMAISSSICILQNESINDIDSLLNILFVDGYVNKNGKSYSISDLGRKFLIEDGYDKINKRKRNREKAEDNKNWKERYWLLILIAGWTIGVATTILLEVLKPQAVQSLKLLIGIQ